MGLNRHTKGVSSVTFDGDLSHGEVVDLTERENAAGDPLSPPTFRDFVGMQWRRPDVKVSETGGANTR